MKVREQPWVLLLGCHPDCLFAYLFEAESLIGLKLDLVGRVRAATLTGICLSLPPL